MHDEDLFRIVCTRSWLPCGVIWWEVAACHAVLGSFSSVKRGVHNFVDKSWTLEGTTNISITGDVNYFHNDIFWNKTHFVLFTVNFIAAGDGIGKSCRCDNSTGSEYRGQGV